MSTKQSTIDFLVEQAGSRTNLAFRKMFGEYALYCQGKVVALVCDDELYIKPTQAGRTVLREIIEKPPYKGAKPYFWISGDKWDDDQWLAELFLVTAEALPVPKRKIKETGATRKLSGPTDF